jgi:hypothetical protein
MRKYNFIGIRNKLLFKKYLIIIKITNYLIQKVNTLRIFLKLLKKHDYFF